MKTTKKLLSLILVLAMIFALAVPVLADGAKEADMSGKTVILHSNDVHGAIKGYANMAALADYYESLGAKVIVADAGDFSQGKVEVSSNEGLNAVKMMNAAGYDVATLGNHEFDFGYAALKSNLSKAEFATVCCNILDSNGKNAFDGSKVITVGGVKIAFIGVNTPESQTKANPALIKGLKWLAGNDMVKAVQAEANKVKADVKIVLAHLGVDDESKPNCSTDLWAGLKGVDFIIDGHSHTVMTAGPKGEPIQSTGTAFANVGIITIDNATKKIVGNDLIKIDDSTVSDAKVAAAAQAIIDEINAEYGKVFAKSEIDLVGEKTYNEATGLFGNRDGETNLGDLITDSMVWSIKKTGGVTKVPASNIVAVTNGGGIRAAIAAGDVTKKDVNTVLPFGNTVALVYVTGAELLEALEASTYCSPDAIGGFPQVSGIDFTIFSSIAYDQGAQYPGSTYYGPKTINRVVINNINGKAFDAKATYAVITNNFLASGGDTYYAFAAATEQFDTGIPLDEALMDYISTELKGVIGGKYAAPQGRIHYSDDPFNDIKGWYNDEIILANELGIVNGMTPSSFAPNDNLTREQYVTMLWRMIGKPAATDTTLDFADAASIHNYAKKAVAWFVENDLLTGYEDNTFRPAANITRAEMATLTYRLLAAADELIDDSLKADAGFTDLQSGRFYVEAVNVMGNLGIINGMSKNVFEPNGLATRAQAAAIIVRTVATMIDAPEA